MNEFLGHQTFLNNKGTLKINVSINTNSTEILSSCVINDSRFSIFTPLSLSFCYQESTNKSNSKDGICNLIYNGRYGNYSGISTKAFIDVPNMYDGDWDTFSNNPFTDGGAPPYNLLFINYTPPTGYDRALFQVKYGNTLENLSIDRNCFNSTLMQFIYANTGFYSAEIYCIDNLNNWIDLGGVGTSPITMHFYEEAIWWYKPITETIFSNITFLSNDFYSINITCKTQSDTKQSISNFTIDRLNGLDNCTLYHNKALDVFIKNANILLPQDLNVTVSIDGDFNYYFNMQNISNFSLCQATTDINNVEQIAIQYGNTGAFSNYVFDTVLNSTLQSLTLYYLTGTETTTFTIMDQDTLDQIEGTLFTAYSIVNGSLQVVASKYSDITGRVEFSYLPSTQYKFIISKVGYTTNEFTLNPILFTSYDIYLRKTAQVDESIQYDKVGVYYVPHSFTDSLNNFTFYISSPYSQLSSYGYILTYPGGTSTQTGTQVKGEVLTSLFTPVGAVQGDTVKVNYWFTSTTTGYLEYTFYYPISISPTNYSMTHNKGETYGLGLFERVFISVLLVLLCVGIASLMGQVVPGMFIGFCVYGYLVYIGFIPLWSILLSLIVGFLFLATRPGEV